MPVFERRNEPLLSRAAFMRRMARHAIIAFGIDVGSLSVFWGIVFLRAFRGLIRF
jgi:hypothetical protein